MNTEIEINYKNLVSRFEDVEYGSFFKIKDNIYIKVYESTTGDFNCYNITNKNFACFRASDVIEFVEKAVFYV